MVALTWLGEEKVARYEGCCYGCLSRVAAGRRERPPPIPLPIADNDDYYYLVTLLLGYLAAGFY